MNPEIIGQNRSNSNIYSKHLKIVECLKIRLFNYLNLNFGKNSDELGLLKMSSSWIDKYYGYTFDFFQSNQLFIYS